MHQFYFFIRKFNSPLIANPTFVFFKIALHLFLARFFVLQIMVNAIMSEAAPVFRNNNVRSFKRFVHIVRELQAPSSRLGILVCFVDNIFAEGKFFRICDCDVDAIPGEKKNLCLRY